MKWQKIPRFLYKIVRGKKMKNAKYTEPKWARKERLALSGTTRTQVLKNKKVYNRKQKHKGSY